MSCLFYMFFVVLFLLNAKRKCKSVIETIAEFYFLLFFFFFFLLIIQLMLLSFFVRFRDYVQIFIKTLRLRKTSISSRNQQRALSR